MNIPEKTIERMSYYRRVLNLLIEEDREHIFSHELANLISSTAAQVRRDFMELGQRGNPTKGYDIVQIRDALNELMTEPKGQKIGLVGVGNLGRAILSYFIGRSPNLTISAAFDNDKSKTGRVISGCRCHDVRKLNTIIKRENIKIGIITVPRHAAQETADNLVRAGVRSIVNWAPVHLEVPKTVFLENRDITMAIEKAAFYAKRFHT